MKAIMLSIQPKWVAKILNCEKIIEVRKRFPSDYVGWVYVYCTKNNNNLLHKNCADIWWVEDKYFQKKNKRLGIKQQPIHNGKVVARFWCDKVDKFVYHDDGYSEPMFIQENGDSVVFDDYKPTSMELKSCVEMEDWVTYSHNKKFGNESKYNPIFAIYITKLEIFDKPKELSEFYKTRCKNVDENNDCLYCNQFHQCPFAEIDYNFDDSINAYICGEPKKPLTRAPESWQYIEVEE